MKQMQKNSSRRISRPIFILCIAAGLLLNACYRGPENLPRLKKKFATHIASLETQKDDTNEGLQEGLQRLGTIQEALKSAENKEIGRAHV